MSEDSIMFKQDVQELLKKYVNESLDLTIDERASLGLLAMFAGQGILSFNLVEKALKWVILLSATILALSRSLRK